MISEARFFATMLIICFELFLFLNFWLLWVFIAVCGLSLVAANRGFSSLQWLLLLRSAGSRHVSFSSFTMQALQLWRMGPVCSMWNASGPGIEFMLPELASRLPATVPPGKSCFDLFFKNLSCCCLLIQLCPTLCDPMDCSMPGVPVLPCLPEFAQIHVHYVGDAIQPSHPLSPHSLLALSLSQHQSLFQ